MIDPSPQHRWTSVRVGLFFLAAFVWLIGVVYESAAIRWIAIGLVMAAFLIGQVIRRRRLDDDPSDETTEGA